MKNNIDSSLFVNYIYQLDSANRFETCFTILTNFITGLGFDGVLYTYLPSFAKQPIMKVSEGYGYSYLQHYIDNNLAQFDHVINQALYGDEDIIHWSDNLDALDDNALYVVEKTKKFGIYNGVSIRTLVLKDGLAMAGVSLVCKKDDAYFKEVCLLNIDIIKVFVNIFHQKIISKSYHCSIFLEPALNSVNVSKRKILAGLANGKNLKNIARELNLNEKYVSNIASVLPKFFGCKNRDQLMYIAGMLELERVINDTEIIGSGLYL